MDFIVVPTCIWEQRKDVEEVQKIIFSYLGYIDGLRLSLVPGWNIAFAKVNHEGCEEIYMLMNRGARSVLEGQKRLKLK